MSYTSAITTAIQNPRLRLLNALRTNSKPVMTFLGLPSFRTAQIVAQTGVDVTEEARAVVSHAKFPPQGLRGQGSAFPAIAYGVDMPAYMKTANETLITCVQIESKAGVENVDAICAVPGVG
ncbi:unnamed protein product [Aspergillus oryzae]|uniref:Unnamed protein product n=2 Tax=Aspergillus oryzae TaxID=5062 RepID=A0AAN4YD05_ASPOZ|nr:unnamed protein product [Aspergillus oryzae]GMF90424.1 unnamed protein product [Aspergillus oryzae]GMG07547.1 unnamed protein product [Aspergillus oryzae]GMG25844.1 unnamed protein product [Aspergillus oryzae]GMG51050.1 unnamed protein product [Aspergillus oryzae var. brunneus]